MHIAEVELHISLVGGDTLFFPIEKGVEKVEHGDLVRFYGDTTEYKVSMYTEGDRFTFLDVDVRSSFCDGFFEERLEEHIYTLSYILSGCKNLTKNPNTILLVFHYSLYCVLRLLSLLFFLVFFLALAKCFLQVLLFLYQLLIKLLQLWR